ncbi:MAG TPA: hypothetical protein DDZ11_00165 [Lentisphaeria bacterium]|nr:hypothetical protein [Lentisphaeria bacterium]
MANLDKIRQMSNEEFVDWLFKERTKIPIANCGNHTDCLECWEEHLGDLVEKSPVLIEYFARRYCPPRLSVGRRKDKEDER